MFNTPLSLFIDYKMANISALFYIFALMYIIQSAVLGYHLLNDDRYNIKELISLLTYFVLLFVIELENLNLSRKFGVLDVWNFTDLLGMLLFIIYAIMMLMNEESTKVGDYILLSSTVLVLLKGYR